MSLRSIVAWSALAAAGPLELALLASGYNSFLNNPQDKTYYLGPSGPVELVFHGQAYTILATVVAVLVAAAILFAVFAWNPFPILVATGGCIVFAALFSSDMPAHQDTQFWGLGAVGLALLVVRIGWSYLRTPSAAPAIGTR